MPDQAVHAHRILQGLSDFRAFSDTDPDLVASGPVELIETHISWVFLAADFAFKIKKPIRNDFVDYSTLQKRLDCCREEVRLGQRYCEDLYLGVVPLTIEDGRLRVDVADTGQQPIEYAVKMRRFPGSDLLSRQLRAGQVDDPTVLQLACRVADFHESAQHVGDPYVGEQHVGAVCVRDRPDLRDCGTLATVRGLSDDNLKLLGSVEDARVAEELGPLLTWTDAFLRRHVEDFEQRRRDGFVRECHGDLHLENVVRWRGEFVPFDGIEFNEALRWIDVLADVAFVVMDLLAAGFDRQSFLFLNAYLEHRGDYSSPMLLRWYLVDRAIVRAKVAAIRGQQCVAEDDQVRHLDDCLDHLRLARRMAAGDRPSLWITHGLSGSGKTTASGWLVETAGAIRLRSDLERGRDNVPIDRYSDASRHAVYARMRNESRSLLKAGFSVIADATFLQRSQRDLFRLLAQCEGVSFGILDCRAEHEVLRTRIRDRMKANADASEANLEVLARQIREQQDLTEEEQSVALTVLPTSGPEVFTASGVHDAGRCLSRS